MPGLRSSFARLSSTRVDPVSSWHTQIKLCAVEKFLHDGEGIDDATAQRLKELTNSLVGHWQRPPARHARPEIATSSIDDRLTQLVHDHASQDGGRLETAVLACLHAVTRPAALRLLSLLQTLPHLIYLRCLQIAAPRNPGLVQHHELRCTHYLARLLTAHSDDPDFDALRGTLEEIPLLSSSTLLSLPLVDAILIASNFRERSHSRLASLLDERRFKTAADLVSWLQTIEPSSQRNDSTAMLSRHFPYWRSFAQWRPDYQHVCLWEESPVLDKARKRKLRSVFDLEGPDPTGRHAALRYSEPLCYSLVPVQPKEPRSLDTLLAVLEKAILCGQPAVDLFIQLCVKAEPDDAALAAVELAMVGGAQSCFATLSIHTALESIVDVSGIKDLEAFSRSLNELQSSPILDAELTQKIAAAAERTLAQSQSYFCAKLDSGSTGETFGTLLLDFMDSLARSEWLHPALDATILAGIRQPLASRHTITAIFRQLKAFNSPYSSQKKTSAATNCGQRLGAYLKSSLGGQGSIDNDAEAALQVEVRFWESNPNTDRFELAQALDSIPTVNTGLYATCLTQMTREDDLVVHDVTSRIQARVVHALAKYLARRVRNHLSVHSCWVTVLGALIEDQGPSGIEKATATLSATDFLQFINDVGLLMRMGEGSSDAMRSSLQGSQGMLEWWKKLAQHYYKAIDLISKALPPGSSFSWLLLSPSENVVRLLDICKDPDSMSTLSHGLIMYLAPGGTNIDRLCSALTAIGSAVHPGPELCERSLDRIQQAGPARWSLPMLRVVIRALNRNAAISASAKVALRAFRRLVDPSGTSEGAAVGQASVALAELYGETMRQAASLEMLRIRMQRKHPDRIAEILTRIGVEHNSKSGSVALETIPDTLVNVIEADQDGNYELCFPLTALSELQLKSRGIPSNWRAVILRISAAAPYRFCIHAGDDLNTRDHSHAGWWVSSGLPCQQICTTRPSLFTYHLSRYTNKLLAQGIVDMENLYRNLAALIKAPPDSCLWCLTPHSVKLWKPATCTAQCTINQRQAPLSVRMQQIFSDPLALDVLLTAAYSATTDRSELDLFAGCPVPQADIRKILDSLPPLATLAAAVDLRSALQSLGSMASSCEALLSWICLSFRGMLVTAPARLQIPSWPNTKQFVLLNSSPDREAAFQPHASGVGSAPVFHGTIASRLFPILLHGLHIMSQTPGQVNGAASGAGVYCGDEPSKSGNFAGKISSNWRNSSLVGNERILLACELAAHKPAAVHVVKPAERLLVRYVFLVSPGVQLPARRHVDTALSAAFSQLKAGM